MQVADIQDLLISSLQEKTDAKKVDYYFGELSDYNKPDLGVDDLPIVLVDFKGDKESSITTELLFNLYIVNIAFSNNKNTRKNAHLELYKLLEQIDTALFTLNTPAKVKQSRKIFDAKIERGYLTIFAKDIAIQTTPKELEQWS